MVIVLRGQTIVLVLVKVRIRIGIILMSGVNTRVVLKLKQVVQMRIQKRTTIMLCSRGEQETSPDVVTSMLKVFSIDVYALLYPGATLIFFTPLVTKKLDNFPDIFHEPFVVSTLVDESVELVL